MTKKDEKLLEEFNNPDNWEDLGEANALGWKTQRLKNTRIYRIYVPNRAYHSIEDKDIMAAEHDKSLGIFLIKVTKNGNQILRQLQSKSEIVEVMKRRAIYATAQ